MLPVLASYLREGPSKERRMRFTRRVEAMDRLLEQYGRSHPEIGPVRRDRASGVYVSNFVARYRSRAAFALGCFADPRARLILQRADTSRLRPDERRAVRQAIEQRGRSCEPMPR